MSDKALWRPNAQQIKQAQISDFMHQINKGDNYADLYQWSIQHPAEFWQHLSEFCQVKFSKSADKILQLGDKMIDARWFVGSQLNFAENLLRHQDNQMAIISYDETGKQKSYTYLELYKIVAKCAQGLKNLGVGENDVVAGFLPNIPETIIAMLATTSLGAIWTSCSPDFGEAAVCDRFGQVKPKVLLVVDSYSFKGKKIDCTQTIDALQKKLHTHMIIIGSPSWQDLLNNSAEKINFVQLPFNHPVYILYSSGTTGVPKCIVHGAGGTLLQHLKELVLHTDLRRTDTLFYYTTCGWMMWNWMVSSLCVGATLLLYEGAPLYPDAKRLWQIIKDNRVTVFGTSAKYINSLAKDDFAVQEDLSHLRTILSTGSPLLVQDYEYVYRAIKPDVCLSSISGGTDIISCFALGCPILPVYAGELQCIGLGMQVEIYNEQGKEVQEEKGELVCTAPFPSMPIYFWQDKENARYLHSYFDKFPGVWTHGDFAQTTVHGGLIIYGRSDSVLKRGGVRIGSAEIYRPLASIAALMDSLVIGQPWQGDIRILLFVVLREGFLLNDALRSEINQAIRSKASPRHIPDLIIQVPDLPRTMNGKLSERAVMQVVMGQAVENKQALANPDCLEAIRLAYGQMN
jgi:acetoacetyl-CoA synthetase